MTATVLRVACRGALCAALPDPRNAYRPYLLRHPVLAFLNAAVLIAVIGGSLLLSLTPEIARLSTITSPTILRLTNTQRTKSGFSTLKDHQSLQQSAQLKAEHMLRYDYFEHTSPDGLSPWVWFDRVKYSYTYAGENLAIDFTEAEDVVTAWMRSIGHRRNLLSDRYTDLGVAVATGEFQGRTATVVVQHFGARRPVPQGFRQSATGPTIAEASAAEASPGHPIESRSDSMGTPVPVLSPVPLPAEPTRAESLIAPERAVVLPDPLGVPGIVLVALPTTEDVARVTVDIPGHAPVLLTRRGGIASARIPFPEMSEVHVRAANAQGDMYTETLRLAPAYTTRAEADTLRTRIASNVQRLRPTIGLLLLGLASLLIMNLLVHLRGHRILHPDLLAHAVLVLVVGTALVLFP